MGRILIAAWCVAAFACAQTFSLETALASADGNRKALETAIAAVSGEERASMEWLVARMPVHDLRTLSADYLVENVLAAHVAMKRAPWSARVDKALFLDAVLPYASVTERRDRWRADFMNRFTPLVASAKTPGEAATLLNNRIFTDLKVKYSTKRRRADQGPYESIETGLASCTGLSVLLIDACRAVGVPARFVGTPLWADGSGNHSWVEIWDGEWKFTGAAEPTGERLNEAWFTDRAATAIVGDAKRAIFATTWDWSPMSFPMVWAESEGWVRGVDVTSRYRKPLDLPPGHGRLRVRVRESGARHTRIFEVATSDGDIVATTTSRDERFDANDHATVVVPLDRTYTIKVVGEPPADPVRVEFARDEQLVDVAAPRGIRVTPTLSPARRANGAETRPAGADAVRAFEAYLKTGEPLEAAASRPFAAVPLSKEDVAAARALLPAARSREVSAARTRELEARVIEIDGVKLPFWFAVYGDKPATGRSLWISMHGGGGAPPRVNDQQWENQKRLYKPDEGVYVAPRAPTDTWNLWHQGHIDGLFDRLIDVMVQTQGVNPDRVYLMGYSAGGDGVYQVAPRMADRFAAAAMMAGHPNEAQPWSLRNLPFALHMGGKDAAFKRNDIARAWKKTFAELAAEDAGGYVHRVEIHEDKGHWMDREDAVAVPWMAKFTRNLRPDRVVWYQDDVTHPTFYWLAASTPTAGSRVDVVRTGQTFAIKKIEGFKGALSIRLDDDWVDLDRPVAVTRDGAPVFSGKVARTLAALIGTFLERGDPRAAFPASISLSP